MLFIFR